MDHKREHRTPPTSKGHGSGLPTTTSTVYGFNTAVAVGLLQVVVLMN